MHIFCKNQLDVSKEIAYKGLIDHFSLFDQEDFHSQKVHHQIKSFYENTLAFQLTSTTYWHKGFRLLSKLYKKVSRKIEQINLPLHEEDELKVDSQVISIDSNQDGRVNPRAWVRIDSQSQKAVFVAIYSYHKHHEHVYLNIALPLPFGHMTGILRMENMEEEQSDGLVLTSQSKKGEKGDEGIYYVTKWFTIRLPLNERFEVWTKDFTSAKLKATHKMWLYGKQFLTINYWIRRKCT